MSLGRDYGSISIESIQDHFEFYLLMGGFQNEKAQKNEVNEIS